MSQFLPDQFKEQETKKPTTPQQGPEAYLSPEERKLIQRYLSFPEEFPPRFKSWLLDHIAVNIPQIPISQIVGFTQFTGTLSYIAASESRSANTYDNLTTVGPQIAGLSDGQYIFLYGNTGRINPESAGVAWAAMSIQVNSTAASDDDALLIGTLQSLGASIGRIKTLSGGGNNTVTAKYKSWDGVSTADFSRRWMIALRIGN